MRLVCFGDSWTAGHGVETEKLYKENANPPLFIKRLREQNSWPRWVAEKLGCQYINNGMCGYGNKFIYNELITSLTNKFITKEDIILIMFSYPHRYVHHNDETIDQIYQLMEIELSGFKHFYFNSFYPSFRDTIIDVDKLPNYFINPKGTVSDFLRDYEIKNDISVWEYDSRSVWNDEKNFWVGDYHPNLLGYKLIADYIYENIVNKI